MATTGVIRLSHLPVDDPRQLYHNVVVVLDAARDINNGQPSALARWIDALDLQPGDRVYHLGSGVGYYTAIIAETVGQSGSVVASEIHPELAERARVNLSGYANVTVHCGDGTAFDPGDCDAILINAGVTQLDPLWPQRLKQGGRLVVPLTFAMTPAYGQGVMAKIVRKGDTFPAEVVSYVAICSCTNLRNPETEELLKKALSSGTLLRLKSLRFDQHEAADTCLVHGPESCLSSADPQ